MNIRSHVEMNIISYIASFIGQCSPVRLALIPIIYRAQSNSIKASHRSLACVCAHVRAHKPYGKMVNSLADTNTRVLYAVHTHTCHAMRGAYTSRVSALAALCYCVNKLQRMFE